MDPLVVAVKELGVAGAIGILCLSFAQFVYRGHVAWIARYELRTKELSEAHTETMGAAVGRVINGNIEARLKASKTFEAFLKDTVRGVHEFKNFQTNQAETLKLMAAQGRKLDEHIAEDLREHGRIDVLEAALKEGGRRITALESKVDKLGEDLAGHSGAVTATLKAVEKKVDTQDLKLDKILLAVHAEREKQEGT